MSLECFLLLQLLLLLKLLKLLLLILLSSLLTLIANKPGERRREPGEAAAS